MTTMQRPHLADPELFQTRAYVGGEWVGADSGGEFDITDPSTGAVIGTVPDMGRDETARAVDAADAAFPAWAALTAGERSRRLRDWFDLIMEHADDLALLMAIEMGKPIREARGEVVYGAGFVEWFAEEAKRTYGDVIPTHDPTKRLLVVKQPVGVSAAITPWNFPLAMITRKVGPALAAGCTVVVKPAGDTPYSALAQAELTRRAGIPAGVFNVVTGRRPGPIGLELTTNPKVRKVSFTGSTEIGRLLMEQSASTIKRVSLELGGNAPFIVFDDADLDAAVEGAIASKYRNAGQTCVCANRILVQDSVHDAFAEKMTAAVRNLKVGPATDTATDIGPLVNASALEKVQTLLEDAVGKGARVLTGGGPHELGGTFFEPTVVAGVTAGMEMAVEEIFGPVAPLYRFGSEEEAVRIANDTPYGLASYFYARDPGRIFRVAESLEYGMVGINTGLISTPIAPFGGVKQSGIGREGGAYGIDEYLETKYLCLGGV
jgi:succinate-semialdehyde dehydrogenase / glutarate-semialdehyde dehydrogenase